MSIDGRPVNMIHFETALNGGVKFVGKSNVGLAIAFFNTCL